MPTLNIDRTIEKKVKDVYEQRILDIMEHIRSECNEEEGWLCEEPTYFDGDDFSWRMVLWTREKGDTDHGYDISFQIAEAQVYGDTPDSGINFALDVVKVGGEIVGGLTPYNYTDKCWVKATDKTAVEERFEIMEKGGHANELVCLVIRAEENEEIRKAKEADNAAN